MWLAQSEGTFLANPESEGRARTVLGVACNRFLRTQKRWRMRTLEKIAGEKVKTEEDVEDADALAEVRAWR